MIREKARLVMGRGSAGNGVVLTVLVAASRPYPALQVEHRLEGAVQRLAAHWAGHTLALQVPVAVTEYPTLQALQRPRVGAQLGAAWVAQLTSHDEAAVHVLSPASRMKPAGE